MYNKKTLSKASAELDKAKAPKKPKDIITDPMGQWKYPGLPTRIPSNDITMKGVGYPVLGVANNGQRKIMLPGADYTFPGADYVDEYPQMRKGGAKKKKTKSLSGTNKLMLTHPLLKNYKNKVYDPNVDYFQDGGENGSWNPEYEEPTTYEFQSLTPEEIAARDAKNPKSWTEEEWTAYEKAKKDAGYQKALVNEPKYFDESMQFVRDWHNSPMYNQMVLNSYKDNKKSADYLTKLRKENIDSIPPLNVKSNSASEDNIAAWSISETGQVEVFPSGFGKGPSIYVHEILHSSDRPRELYNWDHPAYKKHKSIEHITGKELNNVVGRNNSWTVDKNGNVIDYPDWMIYNDPRFPNENSVWHNRVMPISDQRYISGHRGANWKDNEAYKLNRTKNPEYYKTLSDEEIRKKLEEDGISKDDPHYLRDFNYLKKSNREEQERINKEEKENWKDYGHGYISDPTEVRARLGEIRYNAKKERIYDPFTEQITPEIFQQYINADREKGNQPMIPIHDLRDEFTDEEILWMLQNISKNENPNKELDRAKKGGCIEMDLTQKEIDEYRKGGYIVEDISVPELTQAQKGIIQISDPKEYAYRKKMYDDSLTLHNQSLSDKEWLGSQNPVKRYPDGEHLYKGTAWNKHVYDGVLGFNDAMRRLRLANKKTPTGKKTKFSTTAVINGKDDLNPMYSGHTDFTNFKKPTQEVVLKKENKPVQEVKPVENATYKSKSVKVNNTKYPEGYQPYSLHGRVLDPEVYGYSESINEKPVEVAQFGDTYGYKAKMDEYKKSGKYPWVKQEGGVSNDYINANLTQAEIDVYRRGGYIVEDADDSELEQAQNGISKSQKKSWENLGKQLKKPVIKIPKNAAEAQKMMDSGELDYDSWEETKARNIKEAEERKQARLKSLKDYEKRVSNKKYSSLKGLPNEDWREVLANEAAPLGAKFRVSQEDNLFDDYLNPLVMIGSGAQSLGEAPKLAKETNSYMPYVTAVVDPLLTGALSGVGAKNNKQFINNLFNPFASNKTSKYKEPDKIPLTIDDLKNKVEELRTGNGSIKDAEKTFKKIKKESLDFWKTPEGERRVKKYLDENDLTKYGITPQMYSDMMSDINFLDEPTILAAKEKIAKINQARDILNKQKFEISEKIWKLKSNRNKLSDLNNPSTNDLKTIKDIDNELLKLENEISFNSSQDADYMELKLKTPNVDKATGYYNSKNDIIFTGEEWSQPSNTEQTLYHEWGHGKNLKPHLTLDEWFPGTYKIDPVTKKAEDFGKVSPLNKRLRSTIEFEKQTSSGIPEHLDKKLNLDDLYENAQGISALGLQRYTDPKSYYQKALNYFHDSDESNAFLQELLPQFIKKGYIKEQGDLISPQMVEDLFKEYRQESAKKIVEPIRILDIVRPTERSVNRITDELNNLHSLLIGAGGAGAAGATLSDDAESKPELKKGGIVAELSDDEIQDYINQGYVVEDVDDEFQTGGSSSTAKSRLDEINARLQMLERTDEPQYTPKTVTAPVQNIPVSQPVKTAVPVVKQVINKTIEVKRPVVTKPIEKTFQKSKIKQEVKVKTEDTKQKLDKFTKDTLAKIKSQITPTVVPDPNIVNMYKNNYQKHLNSIITDPSKSENLFNNTQLEKEILDRQYIDNVRYGRFDKRGDDVMNRTDFKRNVDSEKYLADIAEDNSVIIDIGSALGNNDPKLSGVSVFELASNPKIKQKNVHVIATDIASGVKDFKTHVKNKTAYDIDYAEVPMNFKTPINKILKDKKLSDKENVYLRTANSIDLLMNVEQTKEHLNHIAKSLKEKTVTYLYNNVILYKPKGKTTFQKLGNINNAGFDHDNKSWLINKNRTPYKLTKPPLR